MKTPMDFEELTKMHFIDFLILRSVVEWNHQFQTFGATIYSVAVDIMGSDFDAYVEVVAFIRGRIIQSLGLYMTIPDNICNPTEAGQARYSEIRATLEHAGVTDVDSLFHDFVNETFKPYKPVVGGIQ